MSSKLVSVLAVLVALAAPARAQFSLFDWSFDGSGTTAFSGGQVNGPDEIQLEILNCIGYAGSAVASTVAHDTGRVTFDLAGEEWLSDCGVCGWSYCGYTLTTVGNVCDDDCPWGAPFCGGVMGDYWGGACQEPETWGATWSLDLLEGECWQIAIQQDGWSLDCNSRLVASNLVFEPAPDVALATVDGTPAYAATLVTLTGTGLDAVEQVLVDGEATPIVTQSPTELRVRPPVGPAGFADLTLRDGTFLLASLPGGLVKWPAATVDVAGGELDVAVDAGVSGDWQLVVSLGTMPPVSFGGTFGFLSLDVIASPWFWVPGALDATGHGEVSIPLPQGPGFAGLDVFVQARTPAIGSSFTAAFSNEVAVVLP